MMEDTGSDSDYSDTNGSVTTSTSSSGSSENDVGAEIAKINKITFRLPKDFCENVNIFEEFFSINTWRELPGNFQAFLKNKFLPTFPENNQFEQEKTLQMLFSNEINRFNLSPLASFHKNLEEGTYRPDILKLNKSIDRSKHRERRFQECEYISCLSKNLLLSRESLLRAAYLIPPGNPLSIDRVINNIPKLDQKVAVARARKKFIEEILHVIRAADLSDSSDNENEFGYHSTNNGVDLSDTLVNNEMKIIGTMGQDSMTGRHISNNSIILNEINLQGMLSMHKRRRLEEPSRPEFETIDIRLRDVHARTQTSGNYKTTKINGKKSQLKIKPIQKTFFSHQDISDATVGDEISNRIQEYQPPTSSDEVLREKTTLNIEKGDSENVSKVPISVEPSPLTNSQIANDEKVRKRHAPRLTLTKGPKKVILTVNGTVVSEKMSPAEEPVDTFVEQNESQLSGKLVNLGSYHGNVKAATLSDLEGVDMMHLPVDLDESGDINISTDMKPVEENYGPELMQETHVCFLSLIRDIFCSTPNHRMKLDDLQAKVCVWLSNPITALNDWYNQVDNWLQLIPSAIQFLAGEFADQPEEFVPYLEFKTQLSIYQWIGAGRDSDQHLLQLYNYWLLRRNEMGDCKLVSTVELHLKKSSDINDLSLSERPSSPPPPRCPTSWTVQPYTADATIEFRIQEKQRFENPHRAFSYKIHGYESVVGPVKGIYTQIFALTKARGHNMLTADRPNFVTILTLVRDATARLPNGEGTRADICELLKSSQYINPQAQDSILQTIVSGALDRMHTEHDPCVRYDPKRKIWIYLHRNRTEEEFERLHQQSQGVGKHKKATNRKVRHKSLKLPTTENVSNSSSVVNSASINNAVSNSPPALSSITQSTILQTNSLVDNVSPPPLTISPPRCQVKPDLISIKQHMTIVEKAERSDAEQIGNSQALLPKSHNVPILVLDSTNSRPAPKITAQTQRYNNVILPSPTTMRSSPVSSLNGSNENKQFHSILTTSPNGQPILHSSNQIKMSNKKVVKPVLVNQNNTSIVSQNTTASHGYIIPANLNNADLKTSTSNPTTSVISTILSAKIVKATSQPPALVNPINAKPASDKSFVRLASTTTQAGKSLISPHIAATNITLQQQQKLQTDLNISGVAQSITNNNRFQHKNLSVNQVTKSQQSVNQKQVIQSIIPTNVNKSNVQRTNANIPSHTVVLPSRQATPQQQAIQACGSIQTPNVSINSSSTVSSHTIGSNLHNPQVIQIQQSRQPLETRVQQSAATCLTQQQQQNFLQNIKQQYKIQQTSLPNQQSLIIKQQGINQGSKQNMQHTSIASSSKAVTSNLNTSIVDTCKTIVSSAALQQSQITISSQNTAKQLTISSSPQTVTRVIKSVTSLTSPQVIATVPSAQEGNAVIAKVLTNNSGQIISLESLLQKQSVASGSTLRVTGTKPNQPNLIQLVTTASQLPQYAVVSQGRNLISVAPAHRIITTQATMANSLVNNLGTATVAKGNDHKLLTAINSCGNQSQKIVASSQIQSMTASQLVNAKISNKTASCGIRMVNASNLNIAHIRGKPVIIASKPANITGQNVILQNPVNSANIVISGQTLKVQGNITSVLNHPTSSQHQTVVLGNQVIKVQQADLKTHIPTSTIITNTASNNTNGAHLTLPNTSSNALLVKSNANLSQIAGKAVVLSSTGQGIRLQSPSLLNVQAACDSSQNQTIVLGTAVKEATLRNVNSGHHRVVLAVQGGGQLLLPSNFQGGAINLKGLQSLKVVSIAQQNKCKPVSKQT